MKKFRLEAGMTVYLNAVGNEARRGSKIKECKLKSIGRKFFYVWDGEHERSVLKFDLETFRQDTGGYSPNWEIHQTEQDILDEHEAKRIHSFLSHDVFRSYGGAELTLDQLRRMEAIALEKPPADESC